MSAVSQTSSRISSSQGMEQLIAEEERSTSSGSNGVVITFPRPEATTETTTRVGQYVLDQQDITDQMNVRLKDLETRFEKDKEDKEKKIAQLQREVKTLKISNKRLKRANKAQNKKLAYQARIIRNQVKKITDLVEENIDLKRQLKDQAKKIEDQSTEIHALKCSNQESMRENLDLHEHNSRLKIEKEYSDFITSMAIMRVLDSNNIAANMYRDAKECADKKHHKLLQRIIDFSGSSDSTEAMVNNIGICTLATLATERVITLINPAVGMTILGLRCIGGAAAMGHLVARIKD